MFPLLCDNSGRLPVSTYFLCQKQTNDQCQLSVFKGKFSLSYIKPEIIMQQANSIKVFAPSTPLIFVIRSLIHQRYSYFSGQLIVFHALSLHWSMLQFQVRSCSLINCFCFCFPAITAFSLLLHGERATEFGGGLYFPHSFYKF